MVYRHAKATGLSFAPAEGPGIGWGPSIKSGDAQATRTTQLRLFDAIASFSSLMEDEKGVLTVSMTRRTFRRNEILAKQGELLKSLMILRSGAAVIKRCKNDVESELTRLSPGKFFCEGGLLTGAEKTRTTQAPTLVVVYKITQQSQAKTYRRQSSHCRGTGRSLRTAQAMHLQASGPTTNTLQIVPGLVARIQHPFELWLYWHDHGVRRVWSSLSNLRPSSSLTTSILLDTLWQTQP